MSDGGRPESQAIPAQNPLVPANPYISEGILIESLTNRITFYKTKNSGFDRTPLLNQYLGGMGSNPVEARLPTKIVSSHVYRLQV